MEIGNTTDKYNNEKVFTGQLALSLVRSPKIKKFSKKTLTNRNASAIIALLNAFEYMGKPKSFPGLLSAW
jgi:hypothetical protein